MKFVIAAVLIVAGFAGGYFYHEHVDRIDQYATASARYLFEPTGVVDKDGRHLRRSDLIDQLLERTLAENKKK